MYALYLIVLYLSMGTVVPSLYIPWTDPLAYSEWDKLRYKMFGITNDGAVCMDNCRGTCHTGKENEPKACSIISNRSAPVYFTALFNSRRSLCITRCGKYGYAYEWCLTGMGTGEWDYCSSEIYRPTQNTYRVDYSTEGSNFCFSECKLNNGKYFCRDPQGKLSECNPYGIHFPARTIYGRFCRNDCQKFIDWSDDRHYCYKCEYDDGKWEYCAPPANNFGSLTKEVYYRTNYRYLNNTPAEFNGIPYSHYGLAEE